MTYERDVDVYERDVIVEREGTGIGTILGIILAVVVVLAIVWFLFLGGAGPATNNGGTDINNQDTTVQVDPPAAQPNGGQTKY
ncbi:MAG: hypothetical protein ABIP53_10355 [Candidatus Limnocylindrales bacterium]